MMADQMQEAQDQQQQQQQHDGFHLLPLDVLVLVLANVPTPHRLRCCSLVSTAWQQAARAATSRVQLRSSSHASTLNLQDWLSSSWVHSQVTQVQVLAAYHSAELQLAQWSCPRLQELTLSHFTLKLPPAAASSLVDAAGPISSPRTSGFAAFNHLSSLSLQYCCLDGLASLAVITGLKHLRLDKPQPPGGFSAVACTLDAGPLAGMCQLTSLHIVKGQYRGLVQSICSLTGLQELKLVRCKQTDMTAESNPAHLWQQLLELTSLRVEAVPGLIMSNTSSTAALPEHSGSSSGSSSSSGDVGSSSSSSRHRSRRQRLPWQQLQVLEVTAQSAGIDPALLAPALQLRRLHLTSTPLAGGAAGTSVLLSALGRLTALEHLNLRGTLQHAAAGAGAGGGDGGGAAVQYAALTASSRLQYLDVARCLLPPEAVLHMFAVRSSSSNNSSSSHGAATTTRSSSSSSTSGARLPKLQQLLLADTFAIRSPAALQAMVSACPALRQLDLTRGTCPTDSPRPPGMLALLSHTNLPHLASLSLSKVDDAAAAELAQHLQQLVSLSVVWQSSITDKGVEGLTALKSLTQLWVHGSLSPQLAPGYLISLQQSTSLPPDVWCQLREACVVASSRSE